MIPSENQPRTWRKGYKLGHGNRKTGIKIATWNTLSLFRTGACQNLTYVLETYGIHIAVLQEIRWSGNGQIKEGKYVIYFSGMEGRHIFGSRFAVHETLEPYLREFNPVSERIAVLHVDTKPLNIVLVCTHAPTDTSDEDIKDAFYEKLAHTYDNIQGNVIKLVLGDLNAKFGREIQFSLTVGSESLHETSNGNGLRLIFFAAAKNMTISNTTFPHKDIHKATWKSPDGITANQIDHILIQKRFRSCIKDIRSYRGADCDTDHFLVVAKFEKKLQSRKQLEEVNSIKIDLEMLKDEEIQQKYSYSIGEYIKGIELNDIDEDWDKVSKAIKEVAAKDIGKTRNKKKNGIMKTVEKQ
jgi:exonuclease III